MSNRSLFKRLLALTVLVSLTTTSSYAQGGVDRGEKPAEDAAAEKKVEDDTYEDKKPEAIHVEQIILRRRQTPLAQQWMAEGLVKFKELKFKDGIDKYTQAETILKQISKSSKTVTGDLDEVRQRLATTYHQYAKALIEKARTDIDISHFEKAKANIAKAIEYDQAMKPEAARMQKRIEQLRIVIEIQERTAENVIDPGYQERIKDILIKKAEARVFMDHNIWKRARDAYEDVLLKDPADEDAINGLHRLYDLLRAAARLRRRAQESERMAEIEWKWIDPIPPRETPGGVVGGPGQPVEKMTEATLGVRQKLKAIIITKISFEDTPVTTVFDFLKTRSRELDPAGEGVNFLTILKPGQAAVEGPANGDDDDDDDDVWGEDEDDAAADDDDDAADFGDDDDDDDDAAEEDSMSDAAVEAMWARVIDDDNSTIEES